MANIEKLIKGCAVLATLLLTVSACSAGDVTASTTDGTLVMATSDQPTSFTFETNFAGYATQEYWQNTGGTLLRHPYIQGESGHATKENLYHFSPELAESYHVSPDGKTVTFRLNPKARSQTGNRLTADDVVFTFERKFSLPTSLIASISAPTLSSPKQVKKVDDDTVSFSVDNSNYMFTLLSMLSSWPYFIYDSTLLRQHAAPNDPYALKWTNSNWNVSFGAYKLDHFEPGQKMEYSANEGYALGTPEVKRIVQVVVPDAGQRASLLKSGDVQIAAELRPRDISQLGQDPAVKTFEADNPNSWLYMPLQVSNPPFNDARVRRALALAIPYEQIMQNVYANRMTPFTSMLDTTAPNFDGAGLAAKKPDLTEARALLAQAGYSASKPVRFTLTVKNSVPDVQEAAVQIRSAAAAAGFDIKIDSVSTSQFYTGMGQHTAQASLVRDFAIVQSPSYVLALEYTPGSSNNWTGFVNHDYSDALAHANAAGDPLGKKAAPLWNQAQRIMQDQQPAIYIGFLQPLVGFSRRVDGYAFRTDNTLDYSNLKVSHE